MFALLCSLIAVALLVLPSLTGGVFVTSSPQLDKHHQALFDAWSKYVQDYQGIKNMYAQDATFRMCSAPFPCEEYEGFDAAFGGFRSVMAEIHTEVVPLTVTKQVLSYHWTNFAMSPKGCRTVFSGVTVVNINDEGIVTWHESFSDNSHGLFECMKEMEEENTAQEAEIKI